MAVYVANGVDDAVGRLAERPGSIVLAGGTDMMVEVNDGALRPLPDADVVVVNRIAELRSWRHDPAAQTVTIGAGVTYTEMLDEPLAGMLPALAEAARTVGSPQIRNAGTLGGNIGTCSPAGDGLPVLAALDASVEVAAAGGRRSVPIGELMLGPKQHALAADELIVSVTLPVIQGWQGYAKVGVRNAMVIAIASTCVVLDTNRRSVAIALGSVGPTVLRATSAEETLAATIDWDEQRVDPAALDELARATSAAAQPIDDHRASAAYRRHAVGVLARRLVARGLATNGERAA
ncbi:MAG: FAD binding domain-containing protein [Actinomycetota bacterium]